MLEMHEHYGIKTERRLGKKKTKKIKQVLCVLSVHHCHCLVVVIFPLVKRRSRMECARIERTVSSAHNTGFLTRK